MLEERQDENRAELVGRPQQEAGLSPIDEHPTVRPSTTPQTFCGTLFIAKAKNQRSLILEYSMTILQYSPPYPTVFGMLLIEGEDVQSSTEPVQTLHAQTYSFESATLLM
jgi:hypothetical protein